MKKTATVIGATGLIGGHLLELLGNDNYFSQINVIVRRPFNTKNGAVKIFVIDFADDDAFKSAISGSDAVFCAVGTTMKKMKGDKTAYRKVDYDIPVRAAGFCASTGIPQFLLVSSVGADSKSSNFYLGLKGEVEDAVRSMHIPSVSIFRPSMLMGKRNESRPAESMAQVLSTPLSFLFPSKYKPVEAHDVAKAMIEASKRKTSGFHIYHYKEISELSHQ
jgi:uncharacterized protein YbjT (DUF2867 family)